MESWADRIRNAEDASAEARAAAAEYDRISMELAKAKAALKAARQATAAPIARRDQAKAAFAEAEAHYALAQLQVENSRNDLARAEAALEGLLNAGSGSKKSKNNPGTHTATGAPPAEGDDVAEPADPVEQAKAQVENAKKALADAEKVAYNAEKEFHRRGKAMQEAEAAAQEADAILKDAEAAVADLEEQKVPAAAAAWEAVRAAATAQRELGRVLAPAPKKRLREPPGYLRITGVVTRLEPPVERAIKALEQSDDRFKPVTALEPLVEFINRYAIAGAMKKVVDRLNRMKVSATRRRVLALSGYHSMLTALAAIEEEYEGLGEQERRWAIRERVDDVEGLANTILLDQEETMQRLLGDRVVQDVQRVRRLNIPDDPAVRGHVVDRVTARL